MTRTVKRGDRVTWNSDGKRRSAGQAIGRVLRRITKPTKIKGHTAKASPDNPQYLVRGDRGGLAAARDTQFRVIDANNPALDDGALERGAAAIGLIQHRFEIFTGRVQRSGAFRHVQLVFPIQSGLAQRK